MYKNAMNILDAIMDSDYSTHNKEHITSLMFDFFMEKKCTIFLIKKMNTNTRMPDKIICIKYPINVTLNDRNYEVPVLIYLPKQFPGEAPQVFVERADEIGVNPKCLNIDKYTLRVTVNCLRYWNASRSNFNELLSEILAEFSISFPVYKLDIKERGKFNYGNDCFLPKDNIQLVTFDAPSRAEEKIVHNVNNNPNIVMPYYQPIVNDPMKNIYNNQNTLVKPPVLEKYVSPPNRFNDHQVHQIYIQDLVIALMPKIKAEYNTMNKHEQILMQYKVNFTQEIEQIQKLAEKKDAIINSISTLCTGVQDQIQTLKIYIEKNNQQEFSFKNIDSFIKISDPEIINIVNAEAVLEDFLFYIKKAFEKKVFNFQETIKLIRIYSRELYAIKNFREKLIRNIK